MAEHQAEVSASARELAREVLIHGPISRAELGRRLGLSPASLTRLSKPFLDRGWFIEAPESLQGATGRPAKPLDVQVDSRRFVGVKITGESVFGVITDLRAGALDHGERTLPGHDVDVVVESVADLVERLRAADGAEVSGLGVSIGGNVAGQRVVTRAPFLGWRDVALADRLEERLGVPVTVENDVTALTTAEQWFGAVRGRPAFAVVTIGAGVGYGLVVHDRVITTPDSGLGLGGHLPLDPSGPLCIEGHRGCSSAMLSIPSITAQVGIALGHEVDYDEVLRLAEEGHPIAVSVTARGRTRARTHDGGDRQHRHGRHHRAVGRGRRPVGRGRRRRARRARRGPRSRGVTRRGGRRRRRIRVVGTGRGRGGDPGRARAAAAPA